MKKKLQFFTFTLLISVVTTHGQPAIKIFAWQQQSLPGTVPVGIKDENGNPIKKAAAITNYFIFLSFKKNYSIRPVQVFIKGSSFAVDTVIEVKKTPVQQTNLTVPNNPHTKILVPKTSNKVIRISPAEKTDSVEKSAHLKNLIKTNDVVVAYVWKEQRYFIAVKTIKELDPMFHE